MMIDRVKKILNAMCDLLDRRLGPVGFVRRGLRLWQRTTQGMTTLVGLEKSRWGHQYQLEIGFLLHDLPSLVGERFAANPKLHHSHVRVFGATLLPGWREVSANQLPLTRWLDAESELDQTERMENIERFVNDRLLPLLSECTAVRELARLHQTGSLAAAIMFQGAGEYLASR